MKIKDIENLTGMNRDNIRFYERQGLLEINRNDNGYREYNEEDIKILKRIKLLRMLDISIEEIKNIQNQSYLLTDVLNTHLEILKNEKIKIDSSSFTCLTMLEDQVDYQTLDADYYLNKIKEMNLEQDILPKVYEPYKRFFARTLDLSIYSFFWSILFVYLFNVDFNNNNLSLIPILIMLSILEVFTMLFLEPILLNKFSTTIGKWVFGIYVQDDNGNNLSFSQALYRTYQVIKYGYGYFIPIYQICRLYHNYQTCKSKNDLIWEEDNILTLKDKKFRRYILFAFIQVMLYLISSINNNMAKPPKTNDLSIYDFSKNYNYYLDEYFSYEYPTINNEGKWILNDNLYNDYPTLNYELENGIITKISFEEHLENEMALLLPRYRREIQLILFSYLKAQDDYHPLVSSEKIIKHMNNHPYESFEFTSGNYSITYDIQYEGYTYSKEFNSMLTDHTSPKKYSISFSIQKNK